ncbi:hypothetical protein [Paraburkholderia caribensis]|uniref:hypothetical protein n=1 Tax=Paraburkholderia caribensis TaxID=75105 RepID=UPI001CB08126|nr:membrane hypothetical protein [Paraburkholderia caribensis]
MIGFVLVMIAVAIYMAERLLTTVGPMSGWTLDKTLVAWIVIAYFCYILTIWQRDECDLGTLYIVASNSEAFLKSIVDLCKNGGLVLSLASVVGSMLLSISKGQLHSSAFWIYRIVPTELGERPLLIVVGMLYFLSTLLLVISIRAAQLALREATDKVFDAISIQIKPIGKAQFRRQAGVDAVLYFLGVLLMMFASGAFLYSIFGK